MQTPPYIEALERALGGVIARAEREIAAVKAQGDALVAMAMARAEAAEAKAAASESRVNSFLASVKDGRDGEPGERGPPGLVGEVGPQGEQGPIGEKGEPGPAGVDGRDGAPGPVGPVGEPGPAGEKGEPGEPGEPGRDGVDGKDGALGSVGPAGRDGVDGLNGKDGADGIAGRDGERGERGLEGPPGRLPIAKGWIDEIHYEGAVVTHDGRTWQATRDTAREPPHEDWTCLAERGADGRGFVSRGTYRLDLAYQRHDVVAMNGGSFLALKDAPGDCPGPDWQLLASPGKRGEKGQTGERGERGPPGLPAAQIKSWRLDAQSYRAVPVMSDGTEGAALEMRDVFEQFLNETR